MARVFVALGSNLGDRKLFLEKAVLRMAQLPTTSVAASSQCYETVPFEVPNQPNFLNGVVELETVLSAEQLFSHLQQIERELGRSSQHSSSEPRVIDLDLLFYDDQVIEQPNLIVPHPRLHQRSFVLFPLAEIAPSYVHPVLKKSITELLGNISHAADPASC